VLVGAPGVANIVRSSSRTDTGDALITFDVALEAASQVIEQLEAVGCNDIGSIVAHRLEVASGQSVAAAIEQAPGHSSEAIVWQQVVNQVEADATPTYSFFALLILATVIAAIGILTDSAILIVGAMVIGPDFGPVGAIILGLVRRQLSLAWLGAKAIGLGVPLAVTVSAGVVVLLRLTSSIPAAFVLGARGNTGFIPSPDRFTVIVAIAAGIAGTLSLIEVKSGVLVGVLISVTTVPAMAGIAVGIAFWDRTEAWGAALQLVINVTCLLLSGALTMMIQHRYKKDGASQKA
jgi:uncharacterized hydrophobic protein (TIGR00271 family)